VASGKDGLTVVGPDWAEPAQGFPAAEFAYPGQLSAPIDATSAAVVHNGRIGVVRAHEPAKVLDCKDCSGVAATNEFVVTSRKNYTSDNGIDIVLFPHDLSSSRTLTSQRLPERENTDYPAENTESPVTLAATPGRITLGYLARAGGSRRGPSIIANYDFTGRLVHSVFVDGIIGESAVSADGRYLAVGVGGSGGACVTISTPVVVDLDTLDVREIQPEVPDAAVTSGSSPWFLITDLIWRGQTLNVTGEVHQPPPDETCDPDPELWRRRFDLASGAVMDTAGQKASASRFVGPGCDQVLEVIGGFDAASLVRRAAGTETRIGNYHQVSPWHGRTGECP
jgi:hypothetical protein